MKTSIILLSLMLLTPSCGNKPQEVNYSRSIDIETIQERVFDDLVEEIHCIPLHKSSNAFGDCWKFIAYKNYLYIYSLSDFAVFIYSNEGQLIRKIDSRGKGKIETPTDIAINRADDELWICDSQTTVNRYSLDGQFIESKQTPTPCIKLAFTDNNTMVVYEGVFDKNSDHLFHAYTNHWEDKGTFVNKGKMTNTPTSYSPSLFAQDWQTNTTYAILKEKSTIYRWEAAGLIPYIYLDFKGDFLTEEKYPEKGFSDKEFANIINENRYTYDIHEFQSVANRMLFHTKGKNSMYYLIDCAQDKDYKFPTLFDDYEPDMVNPVAGSSEQYLYLVQKKETLVEHYEKNKCSYESIQSILSSPEELDGVVICIKLKSDK